MELKLNKIQISLGVIFLVAIILVHTVFVSYYLTPFFYERLRDFLISLVALFLSGYNVYLLKVNSQRDWLYLLLANLFIIIFTTHLLRLFFGGILCK